MKKKLAMVTLLLATAISATGCENNNVKPMKTDDGKSVIFSLTVDGKQEYYTAEDLLADLQDSSTAQSKLYGEVSRQVFTQYALNTLEQKKIDSLKSDAADDVTEFKDDCKTSAKEEGTDYDTYLESQLANRGVETTEELEALFFYEALKEEILEDYIEETGHYNHFLNSYLNTYTPFQVKHILVAANTADSKFNDGTMTADNARKLLKILNGFIAGDSFETLATETDDTSSANIGGVMPFNEAQNYVSEFRFATYVQEIFENHKTLDERFEVAVKLHVVDVDLEEDSAEVIAEAKEEFAESNLYQVYDGGMGSVKISEIMRLQEEVKVGMKGDYNYFENGSLKPDVEAPTIAEQTYEMNIDKYDCTGKLNENYFEEYELERNKIFNHTLNSHKVQYIELDGVYANTTNKTTVNGKTVLADEFGNPIFVALASTGIHFMAMVWNANNPVSDAVTSPYLSNEALDSLKDIINDQAGEIVANPTVEQYNQAYFTLFDSDTTDLTDYQYTYIGRNGAYKSKTTLKSNSDSLLSAITSYVSSLEYHLFNAIVYENSSTLIENENYYSISFYDKDGESSELYDSIKEYVQDNLTSTNDSFSSGVATACESYASKLAREAELKAAIDNWYK